MKFLVGGLALAGMMISASADRVDLRAAAPPSHSTTSPTPRTGCYDCGIVAGQPTSDPGRHEYCAIVDLPDWYGQTICTLFFVDGEEWCMQSGPVCNGNAFPTLDLAGAPPRTDGRQRIIVTEAYTRELNCKGIIVARDYTAAAAALARQAVNVVNM